MDLDAAQHRTFNATLDCHYLLRVPDRIDRDTLLFAVLHGFGQSPEIILPLAARMLGPQRVLAAIEAPYQFFLRAGQSDVGHCWITGKHPESSIRLHHEMLLHVLNEAGREFGIPPARRLLLGFSQPVGLNYRFAATHPDAVRGVIGICGGLPGNWDEGPYQRVQAALLHLARRQDDYYPPAVTQYFAERLRRRAADVEFHLLEGGHTFPSKAKPLVDEWLEKLSAVDDGHSAHPGVRGA